MEQTLSPQAKPFNRFDIPLKMGLLIAVIKIIFSTVQYQFFLTDWTMNLVVTAVSGIIGLVLLYMTGTMQRKALGGYITIKEAFQAIFVAILIMVAITSVYDFIYMKFIDPDMMSKIRESSVAAAEKFGAPQESIDDINKKFDEQEAAKGNLLKQSVSLLSLVVFYSIAGIIIAAIVKKEKPEHLKA